MSGEHSGPLADPDEVEDTIPLTRQPSRRDLDLEQLSGLSDTIRRIEVTSREIGDLPIDDGDHVSDSEPDLLDDDDDVSPQTLPPSQRELSPEELQELWDYQEAQIEAQRNMDAEKIAQTLQLTNKFVPIVRPLTLADLQSCIALENEAFTNPAHRATPEKIEYRLTRCPELCWGLFATITEEDARELDIDSIKTAGPVETGRTDKHVLLAHIIATRIDDERHKFITDQAMSIPAGWRSDRSGESATGMGHQAAGRTVAIHSLAVAAKVQECGLGKLMMRHYFQIMKSQEDVDYVQLLAQNYLVPYYQSLHMMAVGHGKATFGGGGWYNMRHCVMSKTPEKPEKSMKAKGKEKADDSTTDKSEDAKGKEKAEGNDS